MLKFLDKSGTKILTKIDIFGQNLFKIYLYEKNPPQFEISKKFLVKYSDLHDRRGRPDRPKRVKSNRDGRRFRLRNSRLRFHFENKKFAARPRLQKSKAENERRLRRHFCRFTVYCRLIFVCHEVNRNEFWPK